MTKKFTKQYYSKWNNDLTSSQCLASTCRLMRALMSPILLYTSAANGYCSILVRCMAARLSASRSALSNLRARSIILKSTDIHYHSYLISLPSKCSIMIFGRVIFYFPYFPRPYKIKITDFCLLFHSDEKSRFKKIQLILKIQCSIKNFNNKLHVRNRVNSENTLLYNYCYTL